MTTRLCAPGARPVRVRGLEHAPDGWLSRLQRKLAPATLETNVNVALVASVRAGGADVISVSGCGNGENAMSSTSAVETSTKLIDEPPLASSTTGVHTFGAGVRVMGVWHGASPGGHAVNVTFPPPTRTNSSTITCGVSKSTVPLQPGKYGPPSRPPVGATGVDGHPLKCPAPALVAAPLNVITVGGGSVAALAGAALTSATSTAMRSARLTNSARPSRCRRADTAAPADRAHRPSRATCRPPRWRRTCTCRCRNGRA